MLTIGRQDADLTIDDAGLSPRHAELRVQPNGLEVADLGSASGTFIDGHRIDQPTLIGGGSQLQLGGTVLEVEGLAPRSSDDRPVQRLEGATQVTRVPTSMRTTGLGSSGGAPAAQPAGMDAGPSARPAAAGPPAAAPLAAGAPAGASPAGPPAGSLSKTPIGVFSPPSHKRNRGLASRSWIPVALSFGTVILTAIALVIYFAAKFA